MSREVDRSVAGVRARTGHPEISWSILLDATVAEAADPGEAAERVRAAWPPRAGPSPPASEVEPDGLDAARDEAADRPYPEGGPLGRLLVVPGTPGRVVVAAHHAVVDGLGLVGILAAVLGTSLGTTARGVAVGGAPARGFVYPLRRVVEAAVRPPVRVAPRRRGPERGDRLVRLRTEARFGTADLVAAASRAIRRWNGAAGEPSGRVVVAVGASRRPGAEPGIAREPAWFRLEVGDDRSEAVRAQLRRSRPEPEQATGLMRAAERWGVSRLLERRTGSTLLVSHLGRLEPVGPVLDAAFYPAAHGRSGLSIGAIGVAGGTTLTLRVRRADLDDADAAELLAAVAAELAGTPPAPPPAAPPVAGPR